MNKKFLICGAIATALLVSACVKKEEPKEAEPEKVETAQPATSEPTQFESLPSVEQNNAQQVEIPAHVEVERTETVNTSTEIRREPTHEAHATMPSAQAENKPTEAKPAKAESVKTETAQAKTPAPKASSGSAQSEDDAVAAAIAAATPALKN